MAPIVRRQINAVCLVVCRDEKAEAIEDVVLANMLFIHPQHVRRCRGVDFRMVIKAKAINLAEVTRLINPKDHRFSKAIEWSKEMAGRNIMEIPWPNCMLDRLEQTILANTLAAAQH